MAREKQIIKYDLTLETLGEVSMKIEEYLREHNTDAKDIQTALLLLEEVSVRFLEHSPNDPVKVRVRNRLGSISLILSNEAEDFNPISEIKDWGTESEDYFRTLILRANAEKLDYARQSGRNVVHIKARKPKNRMMVLALLMLVAGTVLGLVMVHIMGVGSAKAFDYQVFETVSAMFFNALPCSSMPSAC